MGQKLVSVVIGLLAVMRLGAADTDPAAMLQKFRARLQSVLDQLPDYTCLQSIDRARRPSASTAFQTLDSIRVQVGLISGEERFSWPDSQRFNDLELREMVGRGVVGTGSFALHVRHVFLSPGTRFTDKGPSEARGQKAVQYDFELPVEHSRYKLRMPPHEAEVGVRGSFWFVPESLELLKLIVVADEIDPDLGVMEVAHQIEYDRLPIGDGSFLLPVAARLSLIDLNGEEHRNDSTFRDCRQYRAESKLTFAGEENEPAPAVAAEAPSPSPGAIELPPNVSMELTLTSELVPEKAALGDTIGAAIAKPVVRENQVLVPQGAAVFGRVVRIEKEATPFPHYVVGLEFHTIEAGGKKIDLYATMDDAGPAPGLLRQTKRMDPVFTKRRTKRFDMLVREKPRGQGILRWDAKHEKMKPGLRMLWHTVGQE
jgi:hypothetical protein